LKSSVPVAKQYREVASRYGDILLAIVVEVSSNNPEDLCWQGRDSPRLKLRPRGRAGSGKTKNNQHKTQRAMKSNLEMANHDEPQIESLVQLRRGN
jgi:hypothetical protein